MCNDCLFAFLLASVKSRLPIFNLLLFYLFYNNYCVYAFGFWSKLRIPHFLFVDGIIYDYLIKV